MTRSQPRQEASFPSWLFFGSLVLVSWLTGISESFPWLPFFVSIFVIGLPHGAADWYLLRPMSGRYAIRVFSLYSLAGGVAGLLAWLFPLPAIIGFLILSILHFGISDERDLRSFESPSFSKVRRPYFRFGGVARIAAFLILVCYLRPEGVAQLFGRVGNLLGSEGLEMPLLQLLAKTSRFLLFIAAITWLWSLGVVTASRVKRGLLPLRKGRLEVDLGEALLLTIAAFVLHPVFAVGTYFLTWHASRHFHLLIRSLPENLEKRSGYLRSLLNMHLRSWPLYLPVVPLMSLLILANGSLISPLDWIASLLVVCIVFTLPHHLIVERAVLGNLKSEALH